MKNPPEIIIEALAPFAQHFSHERTWEKAKTLVIGALLTNGRRVVTSALRTMGLQTETSFNQYHHVLSRAVWSPLALAQTLLYLIVSVFFEADEPLVFGVDETIERRWGRKIKARGIYRDAVRSSGSHFVKVSGLRWISAMLLTRIPWAQRVWALPILTALAPSKRFYTNRKREPKTMLERALQLFKQLKRWLPKRDIVGVGDGSYAAIDFLHNCQEIGVTFITRLRLDAALYDPAPPYCGRGRPRKKGARQVNLEIRLQDTETHWNLIEVTWYDGQQRLMEIATGTALWFHYGKPAVPIRWVLLRDPANEYKAIALLCTDPEREIGWIVDCFVRRWQVEVTFEETRRHLGVESQRQWSDKAIERTTPILFGLFSWITLLVQYCHDSGHPIVAQRAAWYNKQRPTFSDALAQVRSLLWEHQKTFLMSQETSDMVEIPQHFWDTLLRAVSYVP
jgi:hypothetical protein